MKKTEIIKHLMACLLNLILYVVVMAGAAYLIYWFLLRFKINGKIIAEVWADFAASFPGFQAILNIQNGLLYAIDMVLTLIFIFGGMILTYGGVIIFGFGIALTISDNFVVSRKNSWCKACYSYEELFHKNHKTRLTGTEWAEKKKKKLDENRKRREREENHTQEDYVWKQYYAKQKAEWTKEEQERQHREGTNQNQPNNNGAISEVEKARLTLMLDNMDFTKKELKAIRNKFIKKFHSDNAEENESYAQKINTAYDTLLPYAKEGI